jgi:hypothetical protein
MAKRLQVILKDPEYLEIQRVARSRRMSIAEWVRQPLDLARRREPVGGASKKLEVIRAAAEHEYPTSDIEGMQLVAASGTYARRRQLRGKVRFTRTLAELKADR